MIASLYHDLTMATRKPPAWALDGRNWILILMVGLLPWCFSKRIADIVLVVEMCALS